MKYDGKIIAIVDETPRVKTIRVSWQGIDQFTFLPGQFMMVSVPGFLNKGGFPLKRAYSIASAPSDKGFIEFTVTRKTPEGLSYRLHQCKVGDPIVCDGPAGHFKLIEPMQKVTFIAAGSGISSMRSMYRHMLHIGRHDFTILFGFHAPEDFIFKHELEHLNVIPAITVEDASWKGKKGRVTELIPFVFPDAPSRQFYLCGSLMMVEDTIKVLTGLGVERKNIFREVW